MMVSLDYDRAMRARFQNGRSADNFMTRIRLLLREISGQQERPMTDQQREELRKLRWCLAEAIDCVMEDDMRMFRAAQAVSARARQIQSIASAFVLASDGEEISAADVNHMEHELRRSAAQ